MHCATLRVSGTFIVVLALVSASPQESTIEEICSLRSGSPAPTNSLCKDNDQNVLLQGRLRVSHSEADSRQSPEALSEDVRKILKDYLAGGKNSSAQAEVSITDMFTPDEAWLEALKTANKSGINISAAIDELLPDGDDEDSIVLKPGEVLQLVWDNVGAPKGWLLVPAMACLFVLLLQCTEVHADSYSMQEEESSIRPVPPPSRLPSWDVVRFALLVCMIWAQLLRAFGSTAIALQIQEFLWPAWFFVTGVFGSGLSYESLARTTCYCLCTNLFLTATSFFFAFFNYNENMDLHIDGSWLLWNLLFFRLLLTPVYHAMKAWHIPGVCFVALMYCLCYLCRSQTYMPITAPVTLGSPKVEALLLMVSSSYATIQSALLHAPYFAMGLLMKPAEWSSFLSNKWVVAAIAGSYMCALLLIVSPLPCWWNQQRCSGSSWAMQVQYHALGLNDWKIDIQMYAVRVSGMFLLVCFMFTCAALMNQAASTLFHCISRCGSRVRFSLALLVWWHMTKPCLLKQPQIPLRKPAWVTDLSLCCPALILAVVLTNKGTAHLFQLILEPYWAKYLIEVACGGFATHFHGMKLGFPPDQLRSLYLPRGPCL
jgi:hypothetical protein